MRKIIFEFLEKSIDVHQFNEYDAFGRKVICDIYDHIKKKKSVALRQELRFGRRHKGSKFANHVNGLCHVKRLYHLS